MFKKLSEKLNKTLHKIRGHITLNKNNVKPIIKDIRTSLLESDVALSVVKKFILNIEKSYLGKEVIHSLTPSQMFIRIIKNELINLLGRESKTLNLKAQPPILFY